EAPLAKDVPHGGALPRRSMENPLHEPAPLRRRWPGEQPGLVQGAGPSSPETLMGGKVPSIARIGSAAKFQGPARKIPASGQDWWGLLFYSPGCPARGSRCQSPGSAETQLTGSRVAGDPPCLSQNEGVAHVLIPCWIGSPETDPWRKSALVVY